MKSLADISGLEPLEPWIADYLDRLSPGPRLQLARKIGRVLRRENARRIRANVQPDGSKMTPRKKRDPNRSARSERARKSGKMFRRIGMARNLRQRASADGVELFMDPNVQAVAARHHHGRTGTVGKKRDGTPIRVKYPKRRLLGIASADRDAVTDLMIGYLVES